MQNKIYWYCYKRQLHELYNLLHSEKLVSCNIDEFTSHFTGKKWPEHRHQYSGKIKWKGEKSLLVSLINYLTEKGFIDGSFSKHFIYGSDSKHQNTRSFINSLNQLFPEKTGYRCKQRLYYRARNKESLFYVA